MTMLNKTSVKLRLRIGQSASRTVVNGEMSLRRIQLSIYEVVTPRGEEEEETECVYCEIGTGYLNMVKVTRII